MHRLSFSPLLIIIIALAIVVVIGCSDDPNAVGIGVLPPQDSLHIVSLEVTATHDTTFQTRINASSSTLLVGQSQNLEARTILSFDALSTIPSASILDSANITLKINYRFKDSTGNFGVEAHRLTRAFTNPTWDTISVAGAYSDTISGRLLVHVTPQDTSLSIPIDTTLIRLWMTSSTGSIILLPTANIVLGISHTLTTVTDTRPLLTVSYHDNADTVGHSFTRRSYAGSFVGDGVIPIIPDRVLLQSGIVDRGIIRFDSLAVPLKASVTKATLLIAADTVQSLTNTYTNDNIFVYLMRKNVYPYDSLALTVTGTPVDINGQKFYQADIRSTMQQWLLHAPNYGVLVKASGELTTFDRLVLYGSNAVPALKPRLKITYTILP